MRLIRLLKNDLAREATTWVAENIISVEQAEMICARYGVDFHNQGRRTYGYFILVSLGYLFVGLALLTLIGANWEEIPRAARMLGLIVLTVSVNIYGIFKVQRQQETAAVAGFFLGGLFYGAAIMLIAQIYHIGEHFPDGIFWWAAGVLPLALLLGSSLLMALASGLAFLWFCAETSQHFFPAMFPVFLAALAWHCLRVKQSNFLFLGLVIGLGLWAEGCLSWVLGSLQRFELGAENLVLGAGVFLVFYGLSGWLACQKNIMLGDYGILLRLWTLRFTVLTLFVFSFEEPWRELIGADWQMAGLVVGLTTVLGLFSVWLLHAARQSLLGIVLFSSLTLLVLLAVMGMENKENAIFFQVTDNIVLLVSGVWLLVRGLRQAVSGYFFLGVFIILATGFLRYMDLVGDYVGATMLFAVFAVILLSAAKYWKAQRVKEGEGS